MANLIHKIRQKVRKKVFFPNYILQNIGGGGCFFWSGGGYAHVCEKLNGKHLIYSKLFRLALIAPKTAKSKKSVKRKVNLRMLGDKFPFLFFCSNLPIDQRCSPVNLNTKNLQLFVLSISYYFAAH